MTDDPDRMAPDVLEAYEVPPPAADLADRFMERWARRDEPAAPRPRRILIAAAAVAAACAAVAGGWLVLRGPGPASGDEVIGSYGPYGPYTDRRELRLPGGHIAVAEAGAELHWRRDASGAMRIDQPRGSVFYRVEPGHAFVVATSAATVTATGTCFDVAVGTAGAPDAIAVYEGAVIVATAAGETRVPAGGRARAAGGAPPTLIARRDAPELAARVAALEAEVRRLKSAPTLAAQGWTNDEFDFSPQQLTDLARQCAAPFDVPPTAGSTLVDQVLEEGYDKISFTAAERAAVARTIERLQPAYETALRALYAELTGEPGESLDPLSMILELIQKSPKAQISAAQQLVARERAGLRPPPADPRAGTVIERYFRLGISAGDEFARALARELPAARVREFRHTWGIVNLGGTCPAR